MAKKKAPDVKPVEKKEDTEVEKQGTTYEMFARKKNWGFTAMTKEASMRSDETKQPPKMPDRIMSAIHKIRKDD